MKIEDLLRQLRGIQTIESIMETLGVSRSKAIYYVHRLRKEGYVKTKMYPDKKRRYYIYFEYALGKTYEDIMNENSPMQLSGTEDYIYKDRITLEETLIYALKADSVRHLLAALALFQRIRDWKLLYRLAKESGLRRQVCALYDVARTIIKVRRMPKWFLNHSLPKRDSGFEEIIPGFRSKTYMNIENRWKVRLPMNWADIEDFLSWRA